MVGWEKYGRDWHKPDGEWAQTTLVEKVVGVHYRKPDAASFAKAAKNAESQGCIYGVRLQLEPDNLVDKNAIMVWGVAETKGWLGRIKQAEWHIGYLPAELAAEIQHDLISIGVPVAAELYSIFEEGDFLEFSIIVLAPKGFGHSSRERAARKSKGSPETRVEHASRLIAEEKFDEAINFLLDCCEGEEALSKQSGHGVAPWCYESLAKIFRKLKLQDEEIAIIERYDAQLKAPGAGPARLHSRLDALRPQTKSA